LFVFTGGLLTGINGCFFESEYMDALVKCWASDPVHSDKISYIKIAMGLLGLFQKAATASTGEGDLRANLNSR
jgi:hypothetical protein